MASSGDEGQSVAIVIFLRSKMILRCFILIYYKMKCSVCGATVRRIIDHMCVDCYLSCNRPSQVQDSPWLFASSFKWRKFNGESRSRDLASAIRAREIKLDKEKKRFILTVDNEELFVPFNVDAVDDLAVKSGIKVGKWLVYRVRSEIDGVWEIIARATIDGDLGTSAKVSTKRQGNDRHVFCVYTADYLDLDDVNRVRDELDALGFTERLCYKPDIYTYLGIHYF